MTVPTKDIHNIFRKSLFRTGFWFYNYKVVLLDEEENILYRYYSSSKETCFFILRTIQKIRELCGDRIEIVSSTVTGYGEELMQVAFGVDIEL